MSSKIARAFCTFLAILIALSIPFWLGGMVFDRFLPASMQVNLPFSALMTFCPAIAAAIMVWRRDGWSGVTALLARTFDIGRIRSVGWLAAAIVLMPAVLGAAFLIMQRMGMPLGQADPIQWTSLPLLFALFFVGAAGEELGWQGYAFELLGNGESILGAALTLGLVWAAWHVIPYVQMGHDWNWVFWQCVVTVFLRVVTVWLYAYGGRSVFVAIVFHAMCNVGFFLFPNHGSLYDPATAALVLAGLTGVMATFWGPRMVAEAPA